MLTGEYDLSKNFKRATTATEKRNLMTENMT
jgi:hypothetical protein